MRWFGKNALRVLGVAVFVWLVLETVRVNYFERSHWAMWQQVASFLIGPWFGVFAVAAGGSSLKRATEAMKDKADAQKAQE